MTVKEYLDGLKSYVAMGCVTVLEIVALLNGIDGALLGVAIAVLAGLGGYEYAKRTA